MIHSSVLYFLNDLLCLTLHRYCFGVHSLNHNESIPMKCMKLMTKHCKKNC